MFARAAGQKPVSAQAARAYLREMLKQAGIDQKISPHQLRHTYATHLLNAGAERVDIKALLGHESIGTTQDLHPRGAGADGAGGGEVVREGIATPICFLVGLLPYNSTIGELRGNRIITFGRTESETTMTEDAKRAELLQEYGKVVDILQSYDTYFLTIKNWGVTVSGAALGVGVTKGTPDLFFVAAALASAFWITERL